MSLTSSNEYFLSNEPHNEAPSVLVYADGDRLHRVMRRKIT